MNIAAESLNLLQDEEMSFIPTVSLPSNALSFAFKRRFGPSDKLRLEISSFFSFVPASLQFLLTLLFWSCL